MIKIGQKQLELDKIKKVYEDCIVEKVETALYAFVAKEITYAYHPASWVRDAHKIVVAFLGKYGLYGPSVLPGDLRANIMKYLVGEVDDPQTCLEDIILFFWRCVADVCVTRISVASGTMIDYLTDEEVGALSKWEAIKKKALEENNQGERRGILRTILNEKNCWLFSNVVKKDIMEWQSGIRNLEDKELDAIVLTPTMTKALHRNQEKNSALDMLDAIFDYDQILNRDLVDGTPRHQLLRLMHVPVCPYCNRQYITLFLNTKKVSKRRKKGVNETTADLDHFYIKSQYPYLSLSLYNFVPSCQICNSRFKGTKDFYIYPHVYPYKSGFGDDVKFITKLDAIMPGDKGSRGELVELQNRSCDEAVKNSISTFMLEQVYQSHGDYVQEIKTKSEAYNELMIKDLKKQYGDLLGDKRSIMDFLYGQYLDQSQFYLRPLSKLTRDILEECYGDKIDWENI